MQVRYFLFLFLFSIGSLTLWSQNTLHTKSKKAEKYYREAITEYQLGNKIDAELLLMKAFKADANFIEAYLLTADIKAELGYPSDAIAYYKKGIAIDSTYYPPAFFYLGKLYLAEGDYQKAMQSYSSFLNFPKQSEDLRKEAHFQKENCLFALQAIKNPVPFQLQNLGSAVNTTKSEYFPTLTVDNRFLLFTRRLNRQTQGEQEDFYGAYQKGDSLWDSSFSIYDINTPFNEGAASLSADGKTLVFTACESNGDYGAGRKGFGSCDLFFSRKKGDHWSKPVNMGPPINTKNWESQPSLSSDGKSIYFVRAAKRGQSNSDIYRADLDENGYWQTPVKLDSTINTDKDEQSVFIHPDNHTLYFASNGHVGMGGTDLYMSRWNNETQSWGKAVNLGYPINTYKDENSILVAPDGHFAYFASDREEGFGGLDLYRFHLPEQIQPQKITYLNGVIFNAKTQQLLGANFELIDLESGKLIQQEVSDATTGSFLLTLLLGKNYLLNVSKPGYLFYSDQFMLQKTYTTQKPFLKDIPLQPIAIGEKVTLKNIFFATDESALQKESEIELNKLIGFLQANPKVHIQIEGHTDDVGTASYNQELSTARAKAVYDFLIAHNVAAERLSYKGFGFTQPVQDNNTEEGRAQNRRTEFLVTKM